MLNKKIISPCISICKENQETGLCYGCARTRLEKKIWKNPETEDKWKEENLKEIKKRMSTSQLITFEKSYQEKLNFGKLVYNKNLKKKPEN
tara:strand:- start:113 stop:385 length:273 start_codon:yes stop_codon:yes gene_type:complete